MLFAAGVGCLALSPRQYVAVSRVALQPGGFMDAMDLNPIPGRPALYDPYFITTEVEKIRSPSVLYRVIKDLGLTTKWQQPIPMEPEEAFQQLSSMVDVRPVRDLNLFEIFVYSDAGKHTAEEGAEIANRIAESYRTNRAAWRNASRQLGIKRLGEELERQDQAVREAQVRVDKLKREYGISEYSADGATAALLEDAWGRRLKPETMRWTEGYEQLIHLYNQLLELREKGGRELRNAILKANPDTVLSKLMQDLSATEASMAKLRVTHGVDHPEFRSLAAMQADLDEKVESRIQGIMAGLELRVRPFRSSLESEGGHGCRESRGRDVDPVSRLFRCQA